MTVLPRKLITLALLGTVGFTMVSCEDKSQTSVQALEVPQPAELLLALDSETSYQKCSTWLDAGLRALYCRVQPLLSYDALEDAVGVPIFLQGPHSDSQLNFEGGYEFGYYNPDFLTWIQTSALVTPERRNWHQPILQSIYDRRVKLIARVYYQSHQALLSSSEDFAALNRQYQLDQAAYQARLAAGETNTSRFTDTPVGLATVKDQYLQTIQLQSLPAEQVGFALGEDFRWLGDYLATRYEGEYEGQDSELYWYIATTSGGFWVRRTIDGTESQMFELLTHVLERYDASWLSANRDVGVPSLCRNASPDR